MASLFLNSGLMEMKNMYNTLCNILTKSLFKCICGSLLYTFMYIYLYFQLCRPNGRELTISFFVQKTSCTTPLKKTEPGIKYWGPGSLHSWSMMLAMYKDRSSSCMKYGFSYMNSLSTEKWPTLQLYFHFPKKNSVHKRLIAGIPFTSLVKI